jgi:hypothetical protein
VHRALELAADGDHELGFALFDQSALAFGQVSWVTQTITLSLIMVRAFVGPRPVYSENKRTTCPLIAAGSE